MVINFFLQSRDSGGAEQFAESLLPTIASNSQVVHLYTNNQSLLVHLQHKKHLHAHKLAVYLDFVGNKRGLLKSLFLAPFAIIYYCVILLKIKARPDKQIVVYSGFSEKIIPGPLAHCFNLPIFFIEYGPLQDLFRKFCALPRVLYMLSRQTAHSVIVPSLKTQVAIATIFHRNQIKLIPCGSNQQKPSNRSIHSGQIIVISRLEKGKGQDLLIKALSLIKKTNPTAKLLIVGQGNFEKNLKQLAGQDPQIKFLNYVSEQQKKRLLQESEIVVCPSVWPLEGFGLNIIEAMAAQKAIVAFNRAPGNELLSHNNNALLAKDGNYLDLAIKISKLLNDKHLQHKLANSARQTFEQKYRIELIAQQYLKLFKS